MTAKQNCSICGSTMAPIFRHTILRKYDVQYFRCPDCEYLTTEKPYWLEEAYNKPIVDADCGIMERNLHNTVRMSAVLYALVGAQAHVLDVAGGFGILTRLLRDVGFDCHWTDPYAQNMLAPHFAQPKKNQAYDVVCAFEVFEHLEEPLHEVRHWMQRYSPNWIVFSTSQYTTVPDLDWWYYAFDDGQHISFYTKNTFETMAKNLDMYYYAMPRSLHILTKQPLSTIQQTIQSSSILYPYGLYAMLRMRKHSKTAADRKRTLDHPLPSCL